MCFLEQEFLWYGYEILLLRCIYCMPTVVSAHFGRARMSSPWLLDDFSCGSRCCNTTLPLPATCARVLRENTGVCVGVRRPHSGGLRYISALTGGVLFLCLPAVKSMNMAETGGRTAAPHCLGGGGKPWHRHQSLISVALSFMCYGAVYACPHRFGSEVRSLCGSGAVLCGCL